MRALSSLLFPPAVICLCVASASADKNSWKLNLEGGSEYDSNLHRVEVLDGEVSGVDQGTLMRTGARYQQAYRPARGQRLLLDARAALKLFTVPEGQSENLAVVFVDATYDRRLGDSQALLAVRGSYYDAIDIRPFGDGERPVVGRSFRTSEAEASLTLPSGSAHRLSLQTGLHDFVYKPDNDFDWQGQDLGLRYAGVFWRGDPDKDEDAASIELRAIYRAGIRNYAGPAFRNTCSPDAMVEPECFVPTEESRVDLQHTMLVEGMYTGRRIYSLLYGADVIDSNSYGQASVRQRIELAVTSSIPGQFFLTARAIIRINTFLDPLLLARDVQSQSFVSIEDENRNSLSLHLARDVGKHWGLEARLAVYSNEFATQELRFRRQTAYLGGLYRFEAP